MGDLDGIQEFGRAFQAKWAVQIGSPLDQIVKILDKAALRKSKLWETDYVPTQPPLTLQMEGSLGEIKGSIRGETSSERWISVFPDSIQKQLDSEGCQDSMTDLFSNHAQLRMEVDVQGPCLRIKDRTLPIYNDAERRGKLQYHISQFFANVYAAHQGDDKGHERHEYGFKYETPQREGLTRHVIASNRVIMHGDIEKILKAGFCLDSGADVGVFFEAMYLETSGNRRQRTTWNLGGCEVVEVIQDAKERGIVRIGYTFDYARKGYAKERINDVAIRLRLQPLP